MRVCGTSRIPPPPEVGGPLRPFLWYVYSARTSARQEDVVLGEGLAMIFTPPEHALALDLGGSAEHLVPLFLASPEYRLLCDASSGE